METPDLRRDPLLESVKPYRASSRKIDAMRFNVNVNLDSVQDLMILTKALKEAATLQAIVKLEKQLKELKAEKKFHIVVGGK